MRSANACAPTSADTRPPSTARLRMLVTSTCIRCGAAKGWPRRASAAHSPAGPRSNSAATTADASTTRVTAPLAPIGIAIGKDGLDIQMASGHANTLPRLLEQHIRIRQRGGSYELLPQVLLQRRSEEHTSELQSRPH